MLPDELLRIGDALVGYEFITATVATTIFRNSFVIADATDGPFTINLPPVAEGLTVIVKKIDAANDVTVDAFSTEQIDGSDTFVLGVQHESVTFISDGTSWHTLTGGTGGSGADGADGVNGSGLAFTYQFSGSTTDSDPGSGIFRLNNATLSSVTAAFIDNEDSTATDVSAALDTFDDSTSTIKGFLRFVKAGAPENWALYSLSAITDSTGYRTATLTHVASAGSFSGGDTVVVLFSRTGDRGIQGFTGNQGLQGEPGEDGLTGGIAVRYVFDATTSSGDPGSGLFRLNNATESSATSAFIDDLDGDGTDVSSILQLSGTGDSTTKSHMMLTHATDPSIWALYGVTASTDSTGFWTLTISFVEGNGSFSNGNDVVISFAMTGDKGSDANITPGTTDNAVVRADGTGNDAIQGSNATLDDAGNLTLAERLQFSFSTETVAIGSGSLAAVTTGSRNVAIGNNAGAALTGAQNCVLIGFDSGKSLTTGSCVFIGSSAGTNVTGGGNFGLGTFAAQGDASGASGTNNIGIGVSALVTFTTASDNVAIGNAAGNAMTTGTSNMLIGRDAGRSLTDSSNSVFVGASSGLNATGASNVGIGRTSLRGDAAGLTGNNNIGIGTFTGLNLTSGGTNVFIGSNAGRTLTTGSDNVCIGDSAGFNASQLVSASNSICIGADSFNTASNQIVIGNTSHTAAVIHGGLTVNDAGNDADTRIEGDTKTHIFFIDASAATENIALCATAAPNWQSMDGGLFLENADTAPTGNPSGGVFIYAESGNLKVRESGGDVHTIGFPALFEQYGSGTAYTLTATPAAINMGTDDPQITITQAGTYKVSMGVEWTHDSESGLLREALFTLRRTNNTAADLANGSIRDSISGSTATPTTTFSSVYWEAESYVTANTDDVLTIFGSVDTTGGGDSTVTKAFIKAERVG